MVDTETLMQGMRTFIRKLKPKRDYLHCDDCGRAQTVLFSAYWTWMPSSGHISSSAIQKNERVDHNEQGHPKFTRIGMLCKSCLIGRIERWENAPDKEETE